MLTLFQSIFYAWRATGNTKYQDLAAVCLQNLLKYAKAPAAYAPLIDVTRTDLSLDNLNDDTEVNSIFHVFGCFSAYNR